jgi:phage terminase large subunit GpA-like protein
MKPRLHGPLRASAAVAPDDRFARLRAETFAALRPPPKLRLSQWCESHVRLPASLSATPGPMRLWPQQVEILDVIGDEVTERVSILKSARVGATQAMVAALGHFVQNDPAPVIALVPSEEDARTLMVANIEPVFAESPALRAALTQDAARDTLLHRRYPGGSLMVLSARAPRNLRARTARVLFADEVDGYEIDLRGEGDPIELAIRRTATFGNRKIVLASTPLAEQTSRIVRAYDQSDRRVYELPCPGCGTFAEVKWKDIRWPEGEPDAAYWATPCCGTVVEDRQKPGLVERGRWRATAPEVKGHAGFHLTALTSCLPTTSWGQLAREFLVAKRSPETLQPFVNTILGEPWRPEGDDLGEVDFAALRRSWSPGEAPPEAAAITVGVDCQGDRLEASLVAWTRDGGLRVLGHEVIWGSPTEDETWTDLDDLLRRTFPHPEGGVLTVGAAIVDSGNWADHVYAFCRPRTARRVIAAKGMAGFGRPALAWGQSRKTRLAILGVDALKLQIHHRLKGGGSILFAGDLGPDYFDQLSAERLVVRYSRGQPVRRWEAVPGRRNEAFDCLAYAIAARQLLPADLPGPTSPEPARARPVVARSKWIG